MNIIKVIYLNFQLSQDNVRLGFLHNPSSSSSSSSSFPLLFEAVLKSQKSKVIREIIKQLLLSGSKNEEELMSIVNNVEVCIYMYVYISLYECMYVCMYVCMYICMYICMYAYFILC